MRPPTRALRTLPLVALIGLAVAVSAMPVLAADATVVMTGSTFTPATVTVRVGDTVTWTNQDPLDHDATATDGSWATATFGQGGSGAVTFGAAGSFPYICTIHPDMTGTVIVQAAATVAPTNRPTAPATDADPAVTDTSEDFSGASVLVTAFLTASVTVFALVALRRRRDEDQPRG